MRGNLLQLDQIMTIQKVCLFSSALKMIYYLLLFFFFQDYLLHSFRKGAVWVSVSLLKQSKSLQLRTAAISTITVNLAIRTVCYSDSKENHFQATRQKSRSWRKREHAHSKGTNATQQLILEQQAVQGTEITRATVFT